MHEHITLREASDRTGLTTSTLYGYVRTGRLPAKRRGLKIIIVSAEDVDSLITTH